MDSITEICRCLNNVIKGGSSSSNLFLYELVQKENFKIVFAQDLPKGFKIPLHIDHQIESSLMNEICDEDRLEPIPRLFHPAYIEALFENYVRRESYTRCSLVLEHDTNMLRVVKSVKKGTPVTIRCGLGAWFSVILIYKMVEKQTDQYLRNEAIKALCAARERVTRKLKKKYPNEFKLDACSKWTVAQLQNLQK
ncbi:MAG: hypothetical protein Sylvanvirus10_10 [Sylvanvirus sp.]|uniref:Uncharacterized protein n=1 Tax=Sylvanvirus sp. TaxID=2487774 RepID=A0A3G5AKJ6_9VIRU|nr:MAG: hypothetical protein Sylvanvirus10_10 [Sylvanvirus sp.]